MNFNEFKLSVPVLLIAFNRPKITKLTFNKIKEAKPEKLYIAIDGSRPEINGENELVKEVKSIVEKVDWPCISKYKYNDTNQGPEQTVSNAINWMLTDEEYGIILEDDILVPLSFFKFTQEMLIKYKNEKNICMVSGCNFTPMKTNDNADYLFSKYGHISGWATWKRAWQKFNLEVNDFNEKVNYKYLRQVCESKAEAKYFLNKYKSMMKKGKGNNTWDSIWGYIYRTNNLLSIVPKVNLTSHIGVYGYHSSGLTDRHYREYDENFEVKNHPNKIEKYIEYDVFHFKKYILKLRGSLFSRIFRKVMNKIEKFFNKLNN